VKYDRPATLKKYVRVLEKYAGASLDLNIEELWRLDAERQLAVLLAAMKARRMVSKSTSTSLIRHSLKVFEAQLNIQYLPRGPLMTDVYLLQTDDVDPDDDEWVSPEEAGERWRAWAPNSKAMRVPGDHMTMLEAPHVERITKLAQEVWDVPL
jgi:thioesterase domain-containing protein